MFRFEQPRWYDNFRLRYNPMAAVELTLLGNRLEDRARRHRVAIGASTSASTVNEANGGEHGEGGSAQNQNEQSTPRTSRVPMLAIGNVVAGQAVQQPQLLEGENVPSFGPTIERHMERSRHRLLHDEMVQRSVQQHFQHQQQQLVFQAQQQEHRRREVQRQFEVAEQLQEEIQAAEEGENDQENEEQHQQQQQGGEEAQHGGEEEVNKLRSKTLSEQYDSNCASLSAFTMGRPRPCWCHRANCSGKRSAWFAPRRAHIFTAKNVGTFFCALTAL